MKNKKKFFIRFWETILLIQGRLKALEENKIIGDTMAMIGNSKFSKE
jgi:hypothetical protein